MLPVISLKKKDEPLLPQTIESTVEGLTDQGKSEKVKKTKVSTTTTKTKKKKEGSTRLYQAMDCVECLLMFLLLLCLFLMLQFLLLVAGMFLTVLMLMFGF